MGIAFKLDPNPTFRVTVPLHVPGADKPVPLDIIFRHKGRKALSAWMDGAAGKTDPEFLAEVIDSWAGVETEGGAPVPYSPDRLAQLLDTYPTAGDQLFKAYVAELTQARAKN